MADAARSNEQGKYDAARLRARRAGVDLAKAMADLEALGYRSSSRAL